MNREQFDEVWEVLVEVARCVGVAQDEGELGDVIYHVSCAQDRNRHPYMEVRTHDGRRYHIVAVDDGVCGVSEEYRQRQHKEWLREHGLEDQWAEAQVAWEERTEGAEGSDG